MQTQTGGIEPGPGDAPLIVDAQTDFLPGGRVAVPAGDRSHAGAGR
jgi:hypothetical protein